MSGTLTYFDFAENSYNFLKQIFESGVRNSEMSYLSQETCGKYLKHIINEYYVPTATSNMYDKYSVLHTDSLKRLLNFIAVNMGIHFDKETEKKISSIDGYSFTAQYPSDAAFFASEGEIENCFTTVQECRAGTIFLINTLEGNRQRNQYRVNNIPSDE